jgi:hypothetical protein
VGRSHGPRKHAEKDSGRQHYWIETCRINAVEIDRKEILKVRNWKKTILNSMCHLMEDNARFRGVSPYKNEKKKEKKKMDEDKENKNKKKYERLFS